MASIRPNPAYSRQTQSNARLLIAASWITLAAASIAGCNTQSAEADPLPATDRVHEMVAAEPKLATYVENLKAIQAAAASKPELAPLSVKPVDVGRTHWIYDGYLSTENDAWPPRAGSCVALPSFGRVLRLVASKAPPTNVQDWQVQGYGREIKGITQVTHVFVCHQDEAVRGTTFGEHLFEGGFFRGECRAYDPWTKKYLGGFQLKASIPDKTLKDGNPKRQQEKLDWALEYAIDDEAYRLALGGRRPGTSSPSFKCFWGDEAK